MVKIYIETYGCAVNMSDSELMAGLIVAEGHKIVKNSENADLIIINTCTVKNSAESKLFRALKKYSDKKIIISGCIPQAEKSIVEKELKNYTIIGTKQMINIPFAIEETLKGNTIKFLDRIDNQRLNLPKIRQNETVEIIPINEGCIGNCNYCKTKHARGHILSYTEKDIIEQAKQAIEQGVKQIWLTSQDTGAYGNDTNTNIIELLKKILLIKGDYRIRLGMINPQHAKKYLKELIELLNDEKMFKFLHIPIQSGSTKVIKEMNRNYSREDFIKIVKTLRKKVPNIRIATDIIIGYPTENSNDFEESFNLLNELNIEVVNLSRYWKRPNTLAAKLKPLPTKEVKERSIKLKKLFENQSRNQMKKYVGKELEILTETNRVYNSSAQKSKTSSDNKDSQNFARTNNYISVIFNEEKILGKFEKVKIKKADTWNLFS